MLNDRISEQLTAAGRKVQRQTGVTLALRALKYLFAAVVFLFAVDVALHLGSGWRLALGLLFLAGLLALAGALLYIAQVRRSRPEQVARLLESRDPSLRSRLINFLQLRRQLEQPGQAPLTRTLTEQALGDYAAALETRDLAPLTRSPTLRRDLRFAGLALGAVLVLLGVLYPITSLEFLRFLDPFGDHPAYSLTQVEIVEPSATLEVNYNGGVVFQARTHGHRPDDLYLSVPDPKKPGSRSLVPMYSKGEEGFMQALEGLKADTEVFATTKNGRSVSKTRLIRVGLIPKIEHAFVEITPPAYTGLVAHETAFDFKNVTALVGSSIRFRLQSNRPLSSGAVALPEGTPATLAKSAENEVTGALVAKESARLQFSVLDVAGNASQENPSAPLTVTHDLPPTITIDTPTQDGYVCDDFVVEARLSASDDYGLKTIRLHRGLNDVFSPPKTTTFTEVTRSASQAFTFNIKALGVQPGDTISFFAEAVDTCPEPHLARSQTIHLMVISTDEYNNFLRERTDVSDLQGKYSQLLNEFHDRIDEQKELSKALEELAKKPASPEREAQMEKLMQQQAELNQRLGALAEKMDHFVREKPLYDMESELQKTLSEASEKIRESVAKNNEELKKSLEAAQPGATPQSQADALASLEQESKRQAEALEPEQQQAEEQTMPPLKDAALMNAIVNDFNALKYLHETQTTVAAQAKAYENRPNPTDEDKLALRQLANTEKAIQWALAKAADNLREHAEAAEKTFPQAAQSARDLADELEKQKLSNLAGRASNTMSSGNTGESSALAERLRQELDELFAETEPASGQMGQEMDRYMRLQRKMNPGKTFGQMSQSRKFGLGSGQSGKEGKGQGEGGLDGYATSDSSNLSVMGNETSGGGDPKHSGKGSNGVVPPAGPGSKVQVAGTDSLSEAELNRLSGSTRSESALEEYRGLIDAYFNSITK